MSVIGVAAVVLGVLIVWALLVPGTDWLARHDVGASKGSLAAARDAARGRLLTLGAGLLAAGALLFTARNFTLSREGQVTDRYTKAIEQLGSKELDVRIGGIYALERIARDSAKDHPTVMEVLTAFIREHSREPWPPPDTGAEGQERSTRPDVQAAVTVIGRRDVKRDIRGQPIDLTRANLTRARFDGADLSGARLDGADLDGADFFDADLSDANLTRAKLTRANLTEANLTRAYLGGAELGDAELSDADLSGAKLIEANLTRARLDGAHLDGADLSGADLSGAQLFGAHLSGVYLGGAKMGNANFTRADLTGARFAESADLSGAYISGAHLTRADPNDADLTGARFVGANLDRADLSGADLSDADLYGAHLSGAILSSARWPEGAPVPEGWVVHGESGRLRPAVQLSEVMAHYL